jgi:tRNA modification GTPase
MGDRETIAAIATPRGEGGIGVVRLSGPSALSCARLMIRTPRNGFLPEKVPARAVFHGWAHHPLSGVLLDEVLLVVLPAPRSFTGEETVEIQGHGGEVVLAALLDATLAAGCRMAAPGEFTLRAFLNGRLDLAQAEAVAHLIRARSDRACQAALLSLSGGLSREVRRIRQELVSLLAAAEAFLDFEEEDSSDILVPPLATIAQALAGDLDALLERTRVGALYGTGLRVVVTGRSNVGKSSLFNALLGEGRAIVSPHPGTTRDIIEGSALLEGIPVTYVDCAGIRQTTCVIEEEGVRRAKAEALVASLILFVVDSSEEICREDIEIARLLVGSRVIIIINKTDLPGRADSRELTSLLPNCVVLEVSVLPPMGIEDIRQAIVREIFGRFGTSDEALSASLRQREALRKARSLIAAARDSSLAGMPPDAPTTDLRLALLALGEITGESISDELLETIFSRFCVGK